jgi:hypothetical protein
MLMTKAKYIYTYDMCCIAHVTFVIICDSSCARVDIKGETRIKGKKSQIVDEHPSAIPAMLVLMWY